MPGCWTCLPFCENCKPKFYTCPQCGEQGSIYFKKCTHCGRPMTAEDEQAGQAAWLEKRKAQETSNK